MTTTVSGIKTPHKKNVANTDRFRPMKPNKSSSDIFSPRFFCLWRRSAIAKLLPSLPTCKAETGLPIYVRPMARRRSVREDLIDLQNMAVRVVKFGYHYETLALAP